MLRSDAPGRTPPVNRLLAALPSREYNRLLPSLEPTPLHLKEILREAGGPVNHVYFPAGAVLSVVSQAEGGAGVEIGLIGREGMVGLAVFLGAESSPFGCLVQAPGDALRMRAADFRSRVGRDSVLHGLLLRYTHAFMSQASQSAACNSLYPVERRLCRWLLAMRGRVESDRFPMTHEFIAAMLGVRRASVTEVARGLRQAGLIRYGGGHLTILDRGGLERAACPCHRVIQDEFDRLPG